MDTKSKNINFLVKALCIVLCIAFMFGAFSFAINVYSASEFFNDYKVLSSTSLGKDGYELKDSFSLKVKLNKDIASACNASSYKNTDETRAYLQQYRDDFIKCGLEQFKKQKAQYQNHNNIDDDYYYDDFYFEFDYSVNYKGIEYKISDAGTYVGDTVKLLSTDEQVENALGKMFDACLADEYYNSGDDEYDNYVVLAQRIEGLYYYVQNNVTGAVTTNLPDNMSKDDIMSNKYALCIVDGKVQYSDALDGMYNESYSISYDSKNADGYFCIDENLNSSYKSIIELYSEIADTNVKLDLILAIILLILSIAFAIVAFKLAGKRLENGKVKLAFIDYIPSDLHFLIIGGCIAGLVLLFILLMDEFYPSYNNNYAPYNLVRLGLSAIAITIWALFIEFVTSFIRVCRSEKKLYKNLLIYWIAYGIYSLVKLIAKGIKKLHIYNRENVFGYKPQNFKKRLIFFLVGYGVVNLILFIMQIVWSYALAVWLDDVYVFFACFNAMLLLALNIVAVVFVTRYVVELDKIITSAHNRTLPQVNYNKLPQSLKILVSSLHYTNQELNSAVNKAVRDERMRTELITNVSHDLKTPLTSIINYVDLLKQCDIEDENAREYISVLDEKGIKLKRLIDDLIEASKVTSGVITLNPVFLNLSELATQAIVEHQQEFVNNGLELIFKGDKNNVTAFSDGNKTFRIIENLLSNARKYSAKGSRVYADVYQNDGYSVFEIKNISAEPLDISPEELTERFVRGDKSRTNEGNGLGLSIADNLCKAQGGKLVIVIDGDLFKAQVFLPNKE